MNNNNNKDNIMSNKISDTNNKNSGMNTRSTLSIITPINKIINKYQRTIAANFKGEINIRGRVTEINRDNQPYYCVIWLHETNTDSTHKIKCLTTNPIEKINDICVNDIIIINGNITIIDTFLCVNINFIAHTESILQQISVKTNFYQKMLNKLQNENLSHIISDIYSRSAPQFIRNVGVIYFTNNKNSDNSQKFKNIINDCKMKFMFYNICMNNICNDFLVSLKYFVKYNFIDVICIVIDDVTVVNILDIMTRDVVSTLLKFIIDGVLPFTITVFLNNDNLKFSGIFEKITNKTFHNHESFASYLIETNKIFMKQLSTSIDNCKFLIQENLQNTRNKFKKSIQIYSPQIRNHKKNTTHIINNSCKNNTCANDTGANDTCANDTCANDTIITDTTPHRDINLAHNISHIKRMMMLHLTKFKADLSDMKYDYLKEIIIDPRLQQILFRIFEYENNHVKKMIN